MMLKNILLSLLCCFTQCHGAEMLLSPTKPVALYAALKEGNVEEVALLCADPTVDINYQGTIKMPEQTPLAVAVDVGCCPEIIKLLLYTPGINVNLRDKNGHAVFPDICRHPQANEVLTVFLEAQQEGVLSPALDVTGPWFGNRNALHYALHAGNWSMLHRLSSMDGIAINSRLSYTNSHFLHELVEEVVPENMEDYLFFELFFNLVEQGMHITPADAGNNTPFDMTVGDVRFLRLLALFGDPHDLRYEIIWPIVGCTFAHASLGDREELMRVIATEKTCGSSCGINNRTYNGWHMLHFAAYNDHPEMVGYLLSLPEVDPIPYTDSELTPYQIGEIGAQARDQECRSLPIFEDFYRARFIVLMCLEKGSIPRLPVELLERIVNSYRCASDAEEV